MELIVGVDGRDGGSDAVALALQLAADDARIVLVHAYPYDVRGEGGYAEAMHEDALEVINRAGADRRFVHEAVADPSPARALHRRAASHDADLIVVGSCHRGVLGRVLLGDVSRAVVHDAPCAVAIAPRGHREHAGPIAVIGVGYDERAEATAAADFAGALAAEVHAEIRLLTAIRPLAALTPGMAYAGDWPELREANHEAAGELQAARIAALPVPAAGSVVDGVAGEELEKLSRGVDLLVLGSRGWGAVHRVMVGSTADRLAHRAACPVILVPGPGERGHAEAA